MQRTDTIYVALMNEPVAAWRPVQAAPRAGGLYCILSRNDDPESEAWEFASGSLVRCELREMEGGLRLVAVERVAAIGPRLVGVS